MHKIFGGDLYLNGTTVPFDMGDISIIFIKMLKLWNICMCTTKPALKCYISLLTSPEHPSTVVF